MLLVCVLINMFMGRAMYRVALHEPANLPLSAGITVALNERYYLFIVQISYTPLSCLPQECEDDFPLIYHDSNNSHDIKI